MQIGVIGENGLGLSISGDRVGGIALVQIILPHVHQAEELVGWILRGISPFAARKAERQQKQARGWDKTPGHRRTIGGRGANWPDSAGTEFSAGQGGG